MGKVVLRMTLDCSRIAKEIAMMSGLFVEGRGRHCFILEKDKNRKDQKNLRRKLVDLILPETGLSQATNLETRKQNKVDRNAQITSKDVFPKTSAKMIDVRNRKTQNSFDICNREQKTIFSNFRRM